MAKKKYMFFLVFSSFLLLILSVMTAFVTIEVWAGSGHIELRDENGNDIGVINDFAITENSLSFWVDDIELSEGQMIAYRVSKNDEEYDALIPVEGEYLTVYAQEECVYKYQFFIYDKQNQKAQSVLGEGDFYGICFRADASGPKASFSAKEYKNKDGVHYLNGECPVLDVDEAPLYDTYVEYISTSGKTTKKIEGHSTLNFEESGEYTLSVYEEKEDGKRLYAENFPITFIYDSEAEGTVSFEIERNGKGIYDDKREDYQIFSNDSIDIMVKAEDPVSGVESISLMTKDNTYNNGKVILQNGTLGELYASYKDNAGNVSDTYVLNDFAMVDRKKPAISMTQSFDGNEITADVEIKDNESGLYSSKIIWKDEVIRNESYFESHSYMGSRQLRVILPKEDIGALGEKLKVKATDYAGNESTTEYNIVVEDNTAPEIGISGIRDGAITSEVVALRICVDDENLDKDSLDVTVNKESNGLGEQYKLTCQDDLIFREDGKYRITTTAEDISGNKSQESISFTIDNTAPAIEGLEKYKDSRLKEFSLNNDMKDMFVDDSVVSYHIYLNGRDYTQEEKITEPGDYVVQVIAVDQNGNVASDQAEFVIYDESVSDNNIETENEEGEKIVSVNSVSDKSLISKGQESVKTSQKKNEIKMGQNVNGDKGVINTADDNSTVKTSDNNSDKKQNFIIFILLLILLGIGGISALIFVTR